MIPEKTSGRQNGSGREAAVGGAVAPAGAATVAESSVESLEATTEGSVVLVCTTAALSVAAALVHLWIAPQLYVQAWGYETSLWWGGAALYLLMAFLQGLYGIAVLRWPTQPMFVAGMAIHLTALLLYVATPVVEGPFLLREPSGPLDAAGAVTEAVVVVALAALLGERLREKAVSVLLLLGAAIWGLRLLGVLS